MSHSSALCCLLLGARCAAGLEQVSRQIREQQKWPRMPRAVRVPSWMLIAALQQQPSPFVNRPHQRKVGQPTFQILSAIVKLCGVHGKGTRALPASKGVHSVRPIEVAACMRNRKERLCRCRRRAAAMRCCWLKKEARSTPLELWCGILDCSRHDSLQDIAQHAVCCLPARHETLFQRCESNSTSPMVSSTFCYIEDCASDGQHHWLVRIAAVMCRQLLQRQPLFWHHLGGPAALSPSGRASK